MFPLCGLFLLVPLAGDLGTKPPDQPPADSRPVSSASTTRPQQPVAFQPGVRIDWQRREVQVAARVVLRAGALEFLACWPGKEHESIVRCEAAAVHVYLALGLLGLLPGHPPAWDVDTDSFGEPAGDLVDISFRWEQNGRTETADAYEWLRDLEYGRTPSARPWVFAGSIRRPDGALSADVTGVGVALVDFPDSLIALSRCHSSRTAELWVEANTAAIPPEGTAVQLVLRPAAPRAHEVTVDFRGAVWVDGRYCSATDLGDLVRLSRQLDPAHVQEITVDGALRSDELRLRQALVEAGVPDEALRFRPPRRANPTSRPGTRGCGD